VGKRMMRSTSAIAWGQKSALEAFCISGLSRGVISGSFITFFHSSTSDEQSVRLEIPPPVARFPTTFLPSARPDHHSPFHADEVFIRRPPPFHFGHGDHPGWRGRPFDGGGTDASRVRWVLENDTYRPRRNPRDQSPRSPGWRCPPTHSPTARAYPLWSRSCSKCLSGCAADPDGDPRTDSSSHRILAWGTRMSVGATPWRTTMGSGIYHSNDVATE
jgi:hypothetical protein